VAVYVLVHGGNMSTDTWNRLSRTNAYRPGEHLGARYWDGTVSYLAAHGHRVFAPTLKDESTSSLTEYIEQVCGLILENDLKEIILVGHSYGGFVITGVADKMSQRIRNLVYLDSGLPDPGESLMDLLMKVYSGSDTANLPEPSPPYVEKIQFNPATIRNLTKTYIRCMKSEFIDGTRLSKEKIDAEGGGWTYLELPSSHVPMADIPEQFYRTILMLACYSK
jgi:pimeloyl-ACP methyl ester carboxylesterase